MLICSNILTELKYKIFVKIFFNRVVKFAYILFEYVNSLLTLDAIDILLMQKFE